MSPRRRPDQVRSPPAASFGAWCPAPQGRDAGRARTGRRKRGRAAPRDLREGGPGGVAHPGPALPAGGGAMSALRQRAEEYLQMRRSLGYKLQRQGPMLIDFIGYLEDPGPSTVTIEAARARATPPARPPPVLPKRPPTAPRRLPRP